MPEEEGDGDEVEFSGHERKVEDLPYKSGSILANQLDCQNEGTVVEAIDKET